jgi:DNA modification methylase
LCPLQLGVIERAVKLWSAPGETVLSPFAGVGSEGYRSLQLGREFVGVELKRSYFEQACRNLRAASAERDQGTLLEGHAA